ncbi:MAG: Crp/Fnr family transcriptional regulator [Gammaproteobacteria bacterium]|nr:Crp/Fnr family transcriptional regulator [Gammaproteobacteria bacterium]
MDRTEKRILTLLREFPPDAKGQVLAFVEFLQTRIERPAVPAEPVAIPRPAEETVVKAIRRLSATYPMLDRGKMLNETSSLMSQHVLGGREAAEVIDELERLFQAHFERLRG